MTVIKGDKAPWTFQPFRTDEMKATVIQLDRSSKLWGVRDVAAGVSRCTRSSKL